MHPREYLMCWDKEKCTWSLWRQSRVFKKCWDKRGIGHRALPLLLSSSDILNIHWMYHRLGFLGLKWHPLPVYDHPPHSWLLQVQSQHLIIVLESGALTPTPVGALHDGQACLSVASKNCADWFFIKLMIDNLNTMQRYDEKNLNSSKYHYSE